VNWSLPVVGSFDRHLQWSVQKVFLVPCLKYLLTHRCLCAHSSADPFGFLSRRLAPMHIDSAVISSQSDGIFLHSDCTVLSFVFYRGLSLIHHWFGCRSLSLLPGIILSKAFVLMRSIRRYWANSWVPAFFVWSPLPDRYSPVWIPSPKFFIPGMAIFSLPFLAFLYGPRTLHNCTHSKVREGLTIPPSR